MSVFDNAKLAAKLRELVDLQCGGCEHNHGGPNETCDAQYRTLRLNQKADAVANSDRHPYLRLQKAG